MRRSLECPATPSVEEAEDHQARRRTAMSRRIALASAALWLTAGVPVSVQAVVVHPAPSEYDASDRRIEAQVKDALEQVPALRWTVHVVDVQDGVVFLGTESASFLGQFRAIGAATGVPGVR